MKAAGPGDKTVMALYRVPAYLRWIVESLSEEATGGALEPAATAVLDVGLSTIRTFPGSERDLLGASGGPRLRRC